MKAWKTWYGPGKKGLFIAKCNASHNRKKTIRDAIPTMMRLMFLLMLPRLGILSFTLLPSPFILVYVLAANETTHETIDFARVHGSDLAQ